MLKWVQDYIRYVEKHSLNFNRDVRDNIRQIEEFRNVTELLDPLEYEDYHEFIGCGRGYKKVLKKLLSWQKDNTGTIDLLSCF